VHCSLVKKWRFLTFRTGLLLHEVHFCALLHFLASVLSPLKCTSLQVCAKVHCSLVEKVEVSPLSALAYFCMKYTFSPLLHFLASPLSPLKRISLLVHAKVHCSLLEKVETLHIASLFQTLLSAHAY
jgi:hypothetical protein